MHLQHQVADLIDVACTTAERGVNYLEQNTNARQMGQQSCKLTGFDFRFQIDDAAAINDCMSCENCRSAARLWKLICLVWHAQPSNHAMCQRKLT